MTFLITDPGTAQRMMSDALLSANVQRLVQEPLELRRRQVTASHAAFLTRVVSEAPLRAFEGYTFLDRSLLHWRNRRPNPSEFDRLRNGSSYRAGPYALIFEKDGGLIIKGDISGQYPIFYYRNSVNFALTDNIHMIKALFDPSPNALNIALQTTWYSSISTATPFDGVALVPPRHFARVRGGSIEIVCYKGREDYHSAFSSYREALDALSRRLKERCEAIIYATDDFDHRVADVTGGVDSRMALAGFLASGLQRKMVYYSHGHHPDDPDRNVSDYLIGRCGLSRGDCLMQGSATRYSHAARLSAGTFRFMGLKNNNFSDFEETEIASYCRVTGYFGELTKSFGSPLIGKVKLPSNPREAARVALRAVDKDTAFLTDEGREAVIDSLASAFADILSEVGNNLVKFHIYSENKSRFHFGVHTSVANKRRMAIDPVLDPMIMSAARFLDDDALQANRIAYDLFKALGQEELATQPYAGFRWGRDAIETDYDAYYDRSVVVRRGSDALGPALPTQRHYSFASDGRHVDTHFDREYLPRAPESEDHVNDKILQYFLKIIPESDPLWTLFARERIRPLRPGDGSSTLKVAARDRLAAALFFYTGLSHAEPISRSVRIGDLRTD